MSLRLGFVWVQTSRQRDASSAACSWRGVAESRKRLTPSSSGGCLIIYLRPEQPSEPFVYSCCTSEARIKISRCPKSRSSCPRSDDHHARSKESSQLCRNNNSDLYRCGAEAANRLSSFTAGKVVNCAPVGHDSYRRTVARCSINGVDIAEWLVRNGLALDWPRYSHSQYSPAQDSARHGEKGIWAGTWTPPWEYRACVTEGGRPSACSDGER